MIDNILKPDGEITFEKKAGKPKENKEANTPPTQKPSNKEDIREKILTDLINYATDDQNTRDLLGDNSDILYMSSGGELLWSPSKAESRKVKDKIKEAERICYHRVIPIPTLDVLSCYMEHGETLREYQRIIGYEDPENPLVTTKEVSQVGNIRYHIPVHEYQLNLPRELFDQQNIVKAKQAGLDMRSMLIELKGIEDLYSETHNTDPVKINMKIRLAKYCPQELKV